MHTAMLSTHKVNELVLLKGVLNRGLWNSMLSVWITHGVIGVLVTWTPCEPLITGGGKDVELAGLSKSVLSLALLRCC